MANERSPVPAHVALIGYGEVGRILAEDLRSQGIVVTAYDIQLHGAGATAMRTHAERYLVLLAGSHTEAVEGAGLVVSAVTASQTLAVADACAPGLRHGVWFLDLNSASPGAKQRAAAAVGAGGARYVEGAVMTSVPPYRIAVPLLLGGPDAAELAPLLRALGFAPQVASDRLGVASATKMCRSVLVKGFEAMVIEGFTAARHYGVEDEVLASLRETFPGIDWDAQGAYFFQRAIEHGRRRAEEMREVAQTVHEAGLEPWSATGTADRQTWVAEGADAGWFGERGAEGFARSADWRVEADRILAREGAQRAAAHAAAGRAPANASAAHAPVDAGVGRGVRRSREVET